MAVKRNLLIKLEINNRGSNSLEGTIHELRTCWPEISVTYISDMGLFTWTIYLKVIFYFFKIYRMISVIFEGYW